MNPAWRILPAFLLVTLAGEGASAATCREAIDRFERELHESGLAASAPDRYADLAREAEEAAELRDEAVCMQRVAELEEELARASATVSGRAADDPGTRAARPAPPILLEARDE